MVSSSSLPLGEKYLVLSVVKSDRGAVVKDDYYVALLRLLVVESHFGQAFRSRTIK